MGCGSVGLTRFVAVMGILVSGMCIAPPAFTYFSGRDPSILLPFLKTLQEKLLEEYHKKAITLSSLENLQGLLNNVGENAGCGALVVVCIASANIFMDFLLLIGACCRVRCLLLPWLILSMMELIILGCPTVIFFSLLGTYLLVQGLFLPSILSFSTPTLLVLLAMAIWLTVLAAYWALGAKYFDDDDSEQQLAPQERPIQFHAYKHAQYTQYNNPRHHHQQGPNNPHSNPSAPNANLYPTLPLA